MNARRELITRPLVASRTSMTTPSRRLLAGCLLGALATAAAGCSGSTALPTGFGVNLTISLDPAVRDQVRTVDIHVTGAEQFDKIVDITAFSGTEARIHYVPGVQTGVLTFSADALDAGGVIVAHGSSGVVTLVANQAVSATVEIAGSAGADGGNDGGGKDSGGKDGGADAPGDVNDGNPCRNGNTTTVCRTGSCVAGIAINPATCQADGTCPLITQTACGVYACGATACNTACNADTDCVMGYYCTGAKTCQAKKTPGVGCAANNECQQGLTCLDSVCCMTTSCPSCRNCGSDGTCSLTVGSAAGTADTSGTTCSGNDACNASGVCLGVLGQTCSSGTGCVSGNCVDGVCCSVASCGACRNCGATGTCNVVVSSADDPTGTTCSNDNSCDAMATCKPRWSLVGKVATVEAADSNFVTGVGNFIFFANPNNSGGGAQYFKSFNVSTSVFADESKTNNPLCACGYEGTLVGQPLNNRIYYVANSGDNKYYSAGATTWTVLPGGYPAPRGEAATAVSGRRVYYVGGRGGLTSVQAYDTTSDAWITTGIADAPVAYNQGCAGAFGGVVYVFGGGGNLGMNAYTESTNRWAAIATAPPQGCYLQNLSIWRSAKLVYSDGQFVRVFNPTTQVWETPIPLPALAGATGWTAVTTGPSGGPAELYVLGWVGGQTAIYKWVFN